MSARRLKVLHVVRQFDPSTGGLETYVRQLASRQAARFDVTVLTLDRVFGARERLPRLERRDGVAVIRVSFVGYRRLFLPLVGPGLLANYDIVHIHAADQLLDTIALLSVFRPMKIFMTTHGLFFHTETLAKVKRIYFGAVTKWSLGRVRKVFAVSANDAELLERIGVDSTLLRNPIVPLGDFLCDGRDLLYVGRISANKRLDALVEFMAHLVPMDSSVTLHVVGADSEGLWPELSRTVARKGLEGKVRYHGYLEAAALLDVARTCGFAVSASRYEGFGLSAIEGMSIGLLPCLHDNAAFRETVGLSGCGLLTNFDAPAQAARDFAAWAPGTGPADRRKAARFAHAQSWDAAVEAYERSYLQD